jgi:flagellar biosynthesis protein
MWSAEGEERKAAALSYKQGYYAPVVVASGKGVVAEAIIACAREAGVYVHESPELVKLLIQVDTDQHIPPELYRAVAEVLVWLYRMELEKKTGTTFTGGKNADQVRD